MRTEIESAPGLPAMYFRKKTSGGRAYLQIVESRREGAAVRQQVIATLGRIDELQQSGQLERLLRSGARFADKAIVLDALDRGEAATISTRRIGPALAFERVWEETGCRDVIERRLAREPIMPRAVLMQHHPRQRSPLALAPMRPLFLDFC